MTTTTEQSMLLKEKESLILRTTKDLRPKELGRILIITENLYRIGLLFIVTQRDFSIDHDTYYYSIDPKIRVKYLLNTEFKEISFLDNLDLKFFDIADIGHVNYVTTLLPKKFEIEIGSIYFNSPGRIDLLGLGEVMEKIKEFFLEIIKLKHERKRRRLDLLKYREEIMKERLENVKRFLEITEKHNLDFVTANKLMKELSSYEEELYNYSIEGKLDAVELAKDEE